MPIEKFDALIKHVKTLEDRLEELEGKTKANTNHISELGQTVGGVVDTSDILESRLDSLEGRISSNQHDLLLLIFLIMCLVIRIIYESFDLVG